MDDRKKQRRNLRKISTNLVLVLVSLLLVLVFFEVGLRLYAVLLYPKMMVLDDKFGWRHATNVSRTFVNEFGEQASVVLNTFGFRGSPQTFEKPSGRRRILVLGDSFTEGVQVGDEDLFTARMEMADPELEVINTGVGGYGTVQQYLFLTSEGLRFNPDLVLLMFFENDLSDNAVSSYPGFGPRPYAKLQEDGLQIVETLDYSEHRKFILPFPFRDVLNRHSYFYYFLNTQIYQPILSNQMRTMQQADLRRIDDKTRYRIFDEMIDRIAAVLDAKMIPFLAVIIPNREDAVRGRSEATEVVANLCESRKIDYLPLLNRLHAEAAAGVQLYFPKDIHWTKDGHRVAAEEILRHIHSAQ